jgi:hypothetical protein
MLRLALVTCCLLIAGLGTAQTQKDPPKKKAPANVFVDAKEAGPDFVVQGEYEGTAGSAKVGAQVIALGQGKFQAVVLAGGLPGAGWDGKSKILLQGETTASRTNFVPAEGKRKYLAGGAADFSAVSTFPPPSQKPYTGAIADGVFSGKTDDGQPLKLTKVERKSPTLGAKAPDGAVVLFDGTKADEWKENRVEDGLLPVPATTKRQFKDFKLHVEFRLPFQPTARGQGRGNSGVYVHGREIQVLDSFGLDGKNNECGGFYGSKAPSVNMCLPPLSWQTYDVEVKADPADAKKTRANVSFNGVLVHEGYDLPGNAASIHFQNHGNPVFYRNVWLVELK